MRPVSTRGAAEMIQYTDLYIAAAATAGTAPSPASPGPSSPNAAATQSSSAPVASAATPSANVASTNNPVNLVSSGPAVAATTSPPSNPTRSADVNKMSPSLTDSGIKTFDTTSPTSTAAAANGGDNHTSSTTAAMAAVLAIIGAIILFLISFCLWRRSRRRLKESRLAAAGVRGGSDNHTDQMSLVHDHERFGNVGAPVAAAGMMGAHPGSRQSMQATSFRGPLDNGPMDQHQFASVPPEQRYNNSHWVPPLPVPVPAPTHYDHMGRPHTPQTQIRPDGRMYTPPQELGWDDPKIGPGPTYPLRAPDGTLLETPEAAAQYHAGLMPARVPVGGHTPPSAERNSGLLGAELSSKRNSHRRRSSLVEAAAAVTAVFAHGHRPSRDMERDGALEERSPSTRHSRRFSRDRRSHLGEGAAVAGTGAALLGPALINHHHLHHGDHPTPIEEQPTPFDDSNIHPAHRGLQPPPIPHDTLEPPMIILDRQNSMKSSKSVKSGKSARSVRDELDAANAKAAGRPWPAMDIDSRHQSRHRRHSSESVTSQYPSYHGEYPPLRLPTPGGSHLGSGAVTPVGGHHDALGISRNDMASPTRPGAQPVQNNGLLAPGHNRSLSDERHTRVEDFYAPWVKEMMKDGRHSFIQEEEVSADDNNTNPRPPLKPGRSWRFHRRSATADGRPGSTSMPVWR